MVLCDPRTNVGTAPSARLIGCTRWLETLLASSLVAETVRLPAVLECSAASSFAAETDQLHTELEDSGARVCLPFGHSAWRSRVRGLRLRREEHSRSGNFVVDSLSSSRHVDQVLTRSVGRVHGEHILHGARTNTHAARVNSFGLHSERGNSEKDINSYLCTYNSCGGVRGGTKPRSMSTRGQVGCPAVEKLVASLQQAPGRLQSRRGQDAMEPQPADFPGGGNHSGVC